MTFTVLPAKHGGDLVAQHRRSESSRVAALPTGCSASRCLSGRQQNARRYRPGHQCPPRSGQADAADCCLRCQGGFLPPPWLAACAFCSQPAAWFSAALSRLQKPPSDPGTGSSSYSALDHPAGFREAPKRIRVCAGVPAISGQGMFDVLHQQGPQREWISGSTVSCSSSRPGFRLRMAARPRIVDEQEPHPRPGGSPPISPVQFPLCVGRISPCFPVKCVTYEVSENGGPRVSAPRTGRRRRSGPPSSSGRGDKRRRQYQTATARQRDRGRRFRAFPCTPRVYKCAHRWHPSARAQTIALRYCISVMYANSSIDTVELDPPVVPVQNVEVFFDAVVA